MPSFLLYPASWFFAGRFIVYMGLTLAPAAGTKWLEEQLGLGDFGTYLCQIVLLPLVYIGLYASLRRIGAPSQKFIYFIVALYGLFTIGAFSRATTTGQSHAWIELLLSAGWVLAFVAVAIRGARLNSSEARNRLQLEREAAISIQTEAILRAHEQLRREVSR